MIRTFFCVVLGCVALHATEPDPSAAVVASGSQVYRLRDVDALLAIARRHAGKEPIDEARLRAAIVTALTAREPFLSALVALPLHGPARDRFVLDLLDYQGEPLAGTPPEASAPTPEPVANVTRAVIVALPALTLPRTIAGTRWVLSAEFALRFADRTAANAA